MNAVRILADYNTATLERWAAKAEQREQDAVNPTLAGEHRAYARVLRGEIARRHRAGLGEFAFGNAGVAPDGQP